MLPDNVSRCVPSNYCKHREQCVRFLEPGRVKTDFSTDLSRDGQCEWKIEIEDRT